MTRIFRNRRAAQSLVEFGLVGPMLLVLILAIVDVGRVFLYYSEMSAGSREAARQAVLLANNGSNTQGPACNLSGDCYTPGVVPQLTNLASFGFNVVYADSLTSTTPPSYGTFTPGADTNTPGTITLKSDTALNTVYVFVYQLGPSTGTSGLWATGTAAARTGKHEKVVVDLKMRWQPTAVGILGVPWNVVLDSQTVERLEY